ncbi:thioesterase II family protein [Actinocrispum wychmicini]|uniref:Surfactin synthase thioesterase subunit n=1 Tax=Actinocrispum wychmicini TaxID=1213861 RepID=A0A4R2JB97_9PSEU|nr:alpha/beta fold hydrolase [Actinocrispum wychmicini]TCO56104.1 surfactin synthase thioesterase subunit [Actinocrispum wychmicini]
MALNGMANPRASRPALGRSGRWFVPSSARRALVCLPHAGGSASVFSDWQTHTDAFEVLAARLPGRETRVDEPACTTMSGLLDALLVELAPVAARGCVLFGHSMGALIAYEAARRLVLEGLPKPAALVVSGCVAPHVLRPERMHDFTDEQLVQWLIDINGVDPDILNYPKLLQLMLPTVRADMRLVDDYRYRPGESLDIPVRVLCGKDDVGTPVAQARKWRELTTGRFAVDIFPGDHFFFREHVPRILSAIESDIR